jgi:hypothetical protein
MNNQPMQLSNFIDDFVQSGIYPGGSGVIQDICYKLWDYDGKQPPDSQCAVYLLMQPTDGSNEGKPVEIYWSVGPALDFQPDHTGGFLISSTRAGISNSCNWADVNERLKNTCGLESTHLNGPTGIRALIGGEITLTRVDQKKRDLADEAPAQPGQGGRQNKRTILVPTRFRGAWERGGARPVSVAQPPAQRPGPVAVPPAQTSAPAPAASAPVMTTPHPVQNGNPGGFDTITALREILSEQGGFVAITDLPKHMLNKLVSVTPQVRVAALTAVKPENLAATVAPAGMTFDGTNLIM